MNIKSKKEIDLMRHSGKILSKTLNQLKKEIKPGVCAKYLDDLAEKIIASSNAKPAFKGFNGYKYTICASLNNEVVHGLPLKNKFIKKNDIVSIDCGVNFNGYHTDAAFTLAVGEANEKTNLLIETTKQSLHNAIKIIKHKIPLIKVQKIVQNTIEKPGFSVIRSLSGHGIGKRLHEPPSIFNFVGKNSDIILQKGMTFCLEPMSSMGRFDVQTKEDGWTIVTSDNSLSAHFEHTILVTENGFEILTQ